MSKFEDEAKNAEQSSFLGEFVYFLKTSKKWWLTPIIVILLRFSGSQVLGFSGSQVLRCSGSQVLGFSGAQVLRFG